MAREAILHSAGIVYNSPMAIFLLDYECGSRKEGRGENKTSVRD